MKISKETEKNLAQLQMLEQNMQHLMLQRQQFHMQLLEVGNALKEVEQAQEKPFRIIGGVMIAATKVELEKDLKSKKEMLELRVKNYESQEEKLRKRVEELQKTVMGAIEKEGEGT